MASTYVNHLRLEEITDGEQAGTWGATTNTNLELIGQAFAWGTRAIANASTDNITIADGAADADRSLALKLTGGGQACTVTLLPNTSSKVWIMNNATSYTLTFTAGSGANVAILAGQSKVIATDGLGSGGVVYDLLTNLSNAGTLTAAGDIITSATVQPLGDTAADDKAAFGYTSVLGAIITGQGSTNDVTLVNDADATVLSIPTGSTDITVAGTIQPLGDTAAADIAAIGYTSVEGLILTGQGSTSDVVIKNDADATVASIATGTTIFTLNDDVFVTGRATGTQTADNDGNFDLTVGNFWTFTPDGDDTITLTNPAIGQSGIIYLDNSGGHNLSAHASILINADVLSALDTAGKYMLSYYCTATSGDNTILMSGTGALA
jgi:hypothetical protein